MVLDRALLLVLAWLRWDLVVLAGLRAGFTGSFCRLVLGWLFPSVGRLSCALARLACLTGFGPCRL